MKPLTPDFAPLSLSLLIQTRERRLLVIKENRKERLKGKAKTEKKTKSLLDLLSPEQLKAAGF